MGTPRISRSAALPRGTARAPPPTGSRITAADLGPMVGPAVFTCDPHPRSALSQTSRSRGGRYRRCARSPEGETDRRRGKRPLPRARMGIRPNQFRVPPRGFHLRDRQYSPPRDCFDVRERRYLDPPCGIAIRDRRVRTPREQFCLRETSSPSGQCRGNTKSPLPLGERTYL